MEKRREFEKRMTRKYPLLYGDMYGDPRETIMTFGFDIGPGWYPIIEELSPKLEKLIEPIYEKVMADPDTHCARCGRKRKWHWFFYLIYVIKYFFMNRIKAFKAYPKWRKRDKSWPKGSVLRKPWWKTLYFTIFKFKWYKACKRWSPPYPKAVQVKEKFGCYDKETEVLTKDGWKYFYNLTSEDEIATLENGQYIKYYRPSDIISYHYNGPMYKLVTKGVDLLVTPNHNLYVAVKFPMELIPADKCFGKNKKFLKGGKWSGEELETFVLPKYENEWDREFCGKTRKVCSAHSINIFDWLQFLGWYVARGCCDPNKGEISITCNNTDNNKEEFTIRDVISNCGFKVKKSMEERSALALKLHNKQLAIWLAESCGCTALNKKVPKFIKDLSSQLIEVFLTSLFSVDECLQETCIYTTKSKALSDDIQELILKAGYTSRVCPSRQPKKEHRFIKSGASISTINSKNIVYEVNWMFHNNSHNTSNKDLAKPSCEKWVEYDDMVYCVTVPNNIIHIRRNGKHVWCGNSLRFYMNYYIEEIEELIEEAEKKSYKTCEDCGKPGKIREGGWLVTLCDECEKKRYSRKTL